MISASGGDALSIRRPGHSAYVVRVTVVSKMVGRGDKVYDEGSVCTNIGKHKEGNYENSSYTQHYDGSTPI